MSTISQHYRPSETIVVGMDFASLMPSGDSLVAGQPSVTVVDLLTGVTVAGITVGSPVIVGTVVQQKVTNPGTDGKIYVATFNCGLTQGGNNYKPTMHLIVTSSPPGDNLLASRDEVKVRLGIALSDTSEDARIDQLLLGASGYIRGRTQQNFDVRTYTETVRLDCYDEEVWLEHYPVLSITSIATHTLDETEVLTYTTGIQFHPDGRCWFTDSTVLFMEEPGYNVVTYMAGYPAVPADIREACAVLTSWMKSTADRLGLSSERIGDYMYRYGTLYDMPIHMRAEIPDGFIEGVIARYAREEVR